MKIITCASYYGTGSSAVTDYLSEFSSIKNLGEYEFRFLHDIDGIADLEYHLVENHNRHNSGHALKRYKKLVDFYSGHKFIPKYEPFFNNRWKEISYKYIDSLTDFTYRGWWQYDLLDKGEGFYYRKLFLNKIYRTTLGRKNERTLNVLPKEITYCSRPTKEEFEAKTKAYLSELMEAANPQKSPILMVDQLLPASEIYRFLPYFDDIKVIVVERDPRDLYILEKCEWKGNIIPTQDAETFCKWYKYTRAHRKTEVFDPEKVMLLQFEDLIYKYEETTEKLKAWLGLDNDTHIYSKEKFDPQVSIKNTRTWKKYDIGNDLQIIESELEEYLYRY